MVEAAHFPAQAREALREADSDFGGQRSQAMAMVNQAMEEVRLGFEYGGASHVGPVQPQQVAGALSARPSRGLAAWPNP